MSTSEDMLGEDTIELDGEKIAVGRMNTGTVILSDVWRARFTQPSRHIEKHLRGYGRDQDSAIISLLQLRAHRDMIKMLDQG